MLDLITYLKHLKRPKTLVSAAVNGVEHYKRSIHLPRLVGPCSDTLTDATLAQLIEEESDQNTLRTMRHAEYSPARHVEYLIALIGEMRGLQRI